MRKEKTPLNISINDKNFKLLEKQQELYPALTKGDLTNNILDIYFKGSGEWIPQDKEEVHKEKEASPPSKRMKKNRQSFK